MERVTARAGRTGRADRTERTRERILRLLLSGERTVEALAHELGVTPNAVRAQLLPLEKEGLVEVRGEVPSTRRPAALYSLRPGAESLFSRAYPFALSRLVRVLSERLPPAEFERTMRELGRRMASQKPRGDGEPRQRVEAAVRVLEELGSHVEVAGGGPRWTLSSDSCPIGEAVSADNRSCLSIQTMLAELTGLEVRENCTHGERPHCRFELSVKPRPRQRPRPA